MTTAVRGVRLAPLGRLHLEPVARTLAGTVGRVQPFRGPRTTVANSPRVIRFAQWTALDNVVRHWPMVVVDVVELVDVVGEMAAAS